MVTFLKNNFLKYSCKIVGLLFFISFNSISQNHTDTTEFCHPKTILELFTKKDKDSLLTLKPEKNSFFLVIPVIGTQPATGFVFGGVAQYTFKGKEETAKYSIANLGVTYTSKKQWVIYFCTAGKNPSKWSDARGKRWIWYLGYRFC